jgi:uncharacterized delta-60 repeat protein
MSALSLTRRLLARTAFLGLVASMCAGATIAAPGDIDSTFASNGYHQFWVNEYESVLWALTQFPDGRLVAAGYDKDYRDGGHGTRLLVARFTSAGREDLSFGVHGTVVTGFPSVQEAQARSVAVQTDGKIVIGGLQRSGGSYDSLLVRYNANGSLDTSFGVGGKVTMDLGNWDGVYALGIQTDGRIVAVAGVGNAELSPVAMTVVRLHANGAVDTSFDLDGKAYFALEGKPADKLVLLPSGRIVVAGTDSWHHGTVIRQLTATGTPDASFGSSGLAVVPGLTTEEVLLGAGGKIYLVGRRWGDHHAAVVRLNSNGTVDHSFGSAGLSLGHPGLHVTSGAVLFDGGIAIAGLFNPFDGGGRRYGVVRFLPDGTIDYGFGTGGLSAVPGDSYWGDSGDSWTEAIAVQPNGRIVVGGYVYGDTSEARATLVGLEGPSSESPCSFAVSPASLTTGPTAFSASVTVSGSPTGCTGTWASSSNVPWLSVTSGGSGSGAGPFSLHLSGTANPGGQSRTGTLTIATRSFTVTQQGSGSSCSANATTACMLNGRFRVSVRYRAAFDDGAPTTQASVKVVTGFSDPSYETSFFYFNNPNNIEMMVKMLDQGNTNGAGQPTIAVLFGSATPLRVELTIIDTSKGTTRTYESRFNQMRGATDFTAFVK